MGQGHPRREHKGGVSIPAACEDLNVAASSVRGACGSIASFALRQREKIHVFARLFFALDLKEREGAHRLARAARVERAKRLADRTVLEGAAYGNERVAGVIAERGREPHLPFPPPARPGPAPAPHPPPPLPSPPLHPP